MTYPIYVVNQDWTTFTANQPGATYGDNPNSYTYAVTGFGSIYQTIVDGNRDNPTKVPGAVGVAGTPEGNLPSPLPLYTEDGITIAVVKGDFNEKAIAKAGETAATSANYTLDFSSIYNAENLSTKFVGSFVAEEGTNVGFVVSSKTVYFGAEAVYDYRKNDDGKYVDIDGIALEDQTNPENGGVKDVNTNRTIITLNRTNTASKWGKDSTFTVGGDFLGDYTAGEDFATATAIVENTNLTVNGAVWVGSGWFNGGSEAELFENSSDAVRYFLTVDDSLVNTASLQVRNTGKLTVTGSTVNTVDATIRHDAYFTNTDLTVKAGAGNFNVYGETGVTATVRLTNSTLATNRTTAGNTDTQFNEFVIGKPGNANRKGVVNLIGSKITGITTSTPGEQEGDDPIITVAKADITVNVGGTLDIDANSSVEAKDVVNKGNIIIATSVDGEDWINATTFTNTAGTLTINASALTAAEWEGVKRVVYATNADNTGVDLTKVEVDAGYDTATSKGKIAIAKGVDFRVLYVDHRNEEDAQFAKTVTIDYPADDTDYYVAFNAFSDAGNALAARKYEVSEDGKKPTKIILLDGTTSSAFTTTYTGKNEDFDGLTFLRYGVEDDSTTEIVEGTYDVSVKMTSQPINDNPDAPVYQNRVLVKGFTVGEGVTFSADRVQQMSGRTDIDGELCILRSDVEVVPGDPSKGYVPSFRVGGGDLFVNEGATLTSEFYYNTQEQLIGGGNLDVNATNRDADGKPIEATMTVDGANVNLYQLTIGSNATVTLKNMKIVEAQEAIVADPEHGIEAQDAIEGKPGAVFDKLQMKNPEALDFAKPLLKLENTDVIVSEVFDSRYGVVDMDMKSTLRVLPTTTTINEQVVETPAEIGGGTFHLTIKDGDIDPDVKFYKLVYAKLNSNVVLSCNDDVSDHQEGQVIIGGVTTSYIYTSLAKTVTVQAGEQTVTKKVGQGLFVMDESIRANLFVKTDWDNGAYTFGDMIADGMYYQINAFGKLVEALETAASYEDGTTITVYGDGTTGIHNEVPTVTVTVNDLMTGDVTIQGEATVVGEGDNAEVVYAPIQIVVPFNGAQFFLTAAEGKTITIAKNASLELVREEATTTEVPAISSYAWLGFGSNYERTGGAIQINGSVYGEGQLTLACKTTISETGSIEAGEALQIIPVIFGEQDTAEQKQAKAAASRVSVTGTGNYTLEPVANATQEQIDAFVPSAPQVKAQTLSVLRGEFDTKDSFVQCKSLALSGESDINSDNTIWKVTSNIAAYAAGDADGDWYPVPTGTYSFKNGSVVTVTGEDGNTSDRANFPTYTGNEPVSGNAQFDAAGMTVVFDNSELNVAKSLINAGTLTIDNGSTVKVNTSSIYGNNVVNTGKIEVKSGSLLTVYNNSYGIQNFGAIDVVGGTIWAKKPTGATYYIENKTANAVITLNNAKLLLTGDLTNQIRNWDNATIQINGDVSFKFQPGTSLEKSINGTIINQQGPANTNYAGKVVFGVSNTGTVNGGKNVDLNIVGGTVAFSEDGLTFDMAVTEVDGTADEAVVSAKLSGGTIFVDKEDITLTDSGFKVVDQAVDPEANPPVTEEVSHMVWNKTNSIKIDATGELTLDTTVAGWNNYADDGGKTNKVSLTVKDLTIADGGNLKMDWKQCLTVKDTLTAVATKSITVDLSEGFELLDNDKLVIAYGTANTTIEDFSFVEKYNKYFEVHHAGEAVDPEDQEAGTWTVTGLYLDSSAFIKVSATHDEDHNNGWYKKITDASNVDRAAVMLILDGDFSSEGYVFLNNIETNVRGGAGYSDNPTKNINPPVLPSVTVAGNYVNRLVAPTTTTDPTTNEQVTTNTLPGYAQVQTFGGLTIKYVQEDTSLTINSCTTTGGWIFGGDFFSAVNVTGAAKNTYYYREGDTKVEINGGEFTVADTTEATSNAQSTIAGGIFYYGGGANRDKSAGTATIVGDVNLTITGGSFRGYNIYGGNYATAKSLGQYTSIDGNVTITLSVANNDLAFAKNAAGQTGNIYAGSYGFGTITGNAKVVLTGGEYQVNTAEENEEPVYETHKHTLSFTKLYGGSTGDFRTVAPSGFAVGKMESSIAGDRILSFEGFNGVIGTGSKIEGFNKVSFSKANDLGSFVADTTFNADVTTWEIKSGATVENFEFDFSAGSYEYDFDQKKYVAANDTLILTGFTTEDIGKSFLGEGASVADTDFTSLKVAFDDAAAVGMADDGTWKSVALGIQLDSADWTIKTITLA